MPTARRVAAIPVEPAGAGLIPQLPTTAVVMP
jgi:hypothetical protein